jgi:valyl-tRNA synthetase
MPPPNSNEDLHIGHARFVTLEDILTRYHRMKGEPTLWLPGFDHAGIETQFVYEKKLKKEGKSRLDFSRDVLYQNIWDYVQANKVNIESQLKSMGASCDWTRSKFTLDPEIVKIVYKTFKKLYDEGLLYRGERIVNYCPRCGTAYSQLEVNSVERKDKLYFLDYGSLIIATTRPETIFADVAIAVNPKDKRYEKLIGKTAKIPLIGREIPIITDNLVDISFGTGALKITPGHDATDFEVGQKHKLPIIMVVDETGRMVNTPAKYIGMKADTAREEVVKDLSESGKLTKTEELTHVVGTCYKDGGLIEPMISKQWFIKITPLAKTALEAVDKGEVKFASEKFAKIAKHWLRNLRDWNISRQIVWGMRIPAWRCEKCFEWTITEGDVPKECSNCKNTTLTQDPDTFDTWFSSAQWPYATLQTTKNGDFEYFYPTTVMETAYDILPFWVIRMIMMGLYSTGKVPFRDVLIHGLIRDKEGQKISKSKGNVINPLEMSQKYGTDALRMGIVWGALVENDIALSEDNIRGQRNFANKIWNIARFIQMSFQNFSAKLGFYPQGTKGKLKDEDKEILSKLEETVKVTSKNLDKFRLSEAAANIYQFIWHDLADIYLENTKAREDKDISLSVLRYCLENALKLLHPFMPFVTEQIWQEIKDLREKPKELLISTSWPK